MSCGAKGVCKYAYRKAGRNTVHCEIQTKKGGQWDFCAHQYMCGQVGQWELTKEANDCAVAISRKIEKKMATVTQTVEAPPKKTYKKKKSSVNKKEEVKDADS